MEQQEIANANLVEMLPTNARNTVGRLKIILIIILTDFAINTIIFALFLVLDDGLTEDMRYIIALVRLILRTIMFIDTPIFIWIVLNEKKAFGEFHTVLEKAELQQQKLQQEIGNNGTFLELSQQDYSSTVN
jgi:hypothetical protein